MYKTLFTKLNFRGQSSASLLSVFIFSLFGATWLKADVTDGITAYWNFDGNLNDQAHGASGSSSTVADSGVFDGENGTDGIGFDSPFLGTHSILLNGSSAANENDGHVRITGSDDTHFGGSDTLSISVWIKVAGFDTRWQTVIAHGQESEYRIARLNNTSILSYAGGTGEVSGGGNLNDGNWHHLVAISESGVSTRLYVDGALVDTGGTPNIVNDLTTDLLIGANPEVDERREWNGNIDDVALWNRVLLPSEIAEIYNGGDGKSIDEFFSEGESVGFGNGLTAYWDFDGNLLDQAHTFSATASTVADDGVFDGVNGTDGIGYGTGLFGSSISMNGSSGNNEGDGHVRVTGSADTHFGDTDMLTVSVWAKVNDFDATHQTLISHGEGQEYRMSRRANSNTASYSGGDSDVYGDDGLPDIDDGNWHHIVGITEAGVTSRLYIDGTQISSREDPDIIDDLANDLLIGANPDVSTLREWDGDIDDVALWERALTPQEIGLIYNGGAGSSIGELINVNGEISIVSVLDVGDLVEDAHVNSASGIGTTVGTLGVSGANSSEVTYTLISGEGDTDNNKYTIGGTSGDEILVNTDMSGSADGSQSVRIRAVFGSVSLESVITLALIADVDFDLLPDAYELSRADNLAELTGLVFGPGPGAGSGDFDGDTFSDFDEYNLGLNPVLDDSDLISGVDSIGSLGAYLDGILPSETPNATPGAWGVEDAFPNLTFASLIGIAAEPNSTYIHALERQGTVQRVDSSVQGVNSKTLFLDISDVVVFGDNGGLRSVIFHPEYNVAGSPNRNYFYVFYTTEAEIGNGLFTNADGSFFLRLSRFTRDENTGVADPNSELVMIQQKNRDVGQHFSGGLTFDLDGYLIVTFGDFEFNRNTIGVDFYQDAQRIDRIFQCAVLRLDVDMDASRSSSVTRTLQGSTGPNAIAGTDQSCLPAHNYYHTDNFSGVGYLIPNDNYFKLNPPSAGSSQFADTPVHGDPLAEHQALGVRNAWRVTTDPVDGDVAWFNVGSNSGGRTEKFEEIEILSPGGNYGWPYFEGDMEMTEMDMPPTQYAPVYVGVEQRAVSFYNHNTGRAITGGVFYYGTKFPSLYGKLVYGDANTRVFGVLDYKGLSEPIVEELDTFSINPYQIIADPTGEDILIAAAGTKIYKLANDGPTVPDPPSLLSETGVFADLATLTPHSGMLEYEPAAPLWSDRATKLRWIGVPNSVGTDAEFDDPSEKITYSATGEWIFPIGTTLVKQFNLPLDEGDIDNPAKTRRLETRFMVRGEDGEYYAFTYRWRADGSDADLLIGAETEDLTITREDDTTYVQKWEYPSRTQCFECHQTGAGTVLGVKSRQLNHPIQYAETGKVSNQLATMLALGMFGESNIQLSDLDEILTSCRITDETASLEHRVRSYLDANCSMCHRPESSAGRAQLNLLLATDLSSTGMINGSVLAGDLGLNDPRIVEPGDFLNSILYQRDSLTVGENIMPPLARSLEDTKYTEVLSEWIRQIGMANYNTWVQSNGINGGFQSDDDADTLTNILEYVIGLDAKSAASNQIPSVVDENGNLNFTVPITGDALADGLLVKVEDSHDLISWYEAGTVNSGVEILENTASAGVDGVISVRFLSGNEQRFIRISIEIP